MKESILTNKICSINDDKSHSDVSSLQDISYLSQESKEDSVSNLQIPSFLKESILDRYSLKCNNNDKGVFRSQRINSLNKEQLLDTIEFKDMTQNELRILKRKKFGFCINNLITTYLIGPNCFSQFTNPKEIEKDERVNIFVLVRDKKKDKFKYKNIDDIISQLDIANKSKELSQNIILFIKEMNKIFLRKNYLHTNRINCCWSFACYFLLCGLIICFILLIISLYFLIRFSQKFIIPLSQNILIPLICVIFVLIIVLVYYILGLPMLSKFRLINYMMDSYKDNLRLVESWNKSIFRSHKIRLSIPVTIDYILFNKNPRQDIIITDIEFDLIKKNNTPFCNVDPIKFEDSGVESEKQLNQIANDEM